MNIFASLKKQIFDALSALEISMNENSIIIEIPKNTNYGELSTNIAMTLAAKSQDAPRIIAKKIIDKLKNNAIFKTIQIAGPGFINFTLQPSIWQDYILTIIKTNQDYGKSDIGKQQEVNIEFVSANPTGPLHIGHARGAVNGDVLASLLKYTGYAVTKESYVNDYGEQISVLIQSVYIRYKNIVTSIEEPIPEGLYPGTYLIAPAKTIFAQYGDKLLSMSFDEYKPLIKDIVLSAMTDLIRADLLKLNIRHDSFVSETSLHEENLIDKAVAELKAKGLVYTGSLAAPKGHDDDEWIQKEQLLFKSTEFGDDQDRVLQKANGNWTYFAADVAYMKHKIERGYKYIILDLGADHAGYVKRLTAVARAFSPEVNFQIKVCQLVNYIKDGEAVRMSKRAGNFTTVNDVVSEVGADIIRFMMLTHKYDIPMDFDLDKVKEQSKDNPVFYVQYAHVRTFSILNNAKNNLAQAYDLYLRELYNRELLNLDIETKLIKNLSFWPKQVELAAKTTESHKIAYYLQQLAVEFHGLWNYVYDHKSYRFIIEQDIELSAARLALVRAVQIVLNNGLSLLGIKALETM